MTEKENYIWYRIIADYIPDDYTMYATKVVNDVHILAIVYLERRCEDVHIYTGSSYKELLINSGYMDGIQDNFNDEDWLKYMFDDEEIEVLRKELEE